MNDVSWFVARRRWFNVTVLVLALVLGISGIALAASSGTYLLGAWPGSPGYVCGESVVFAGPPDFRSWTYSYSTSNCASAATKPAGYFGSKFLAYRDGAVCYASSWSYSNVSAYGWGYGGKMCSDPSGVQEWRTRAYHKAYNPSTTTYTEYTGNWSPIQSS